MDIQLTPEMEAFIAEQVRSGKYLDASDVVRDALRTFNLMNGPYESPELEAMLLEAVEGPHEPYTRETLERIRREALRDHELETRDIPTRAA
jgi:putative addiction module CopG family antidote